MCDKGGGSTIYAENSQAVQCARVQLLSMLHIADAHHAIVDEDWDAREVVSKRRQRKEHGKLLDNVAVGIVLRPCCKVEELVHQDDVSGTRRVVELPE